MENAPIMFEPILAAMMNIESCYESYGLGKTFILMEHYSTLAKAGVSPIRFSHYGQITEYHWNVFLQQTHPRFSKITSTSVSKNDISILACMLKF